MSNKTRISAVTLALIMMLSLLSAYPTFMVATAAGDFSADYSAINGNDYAKMNVSAPGTATVGETIEVVITWSDIQFPNSSDVPGSSEFAFYFDNTILSYESMSVDGLAETEYDDAYNLTANTKGIAKSGFSVNGMDIGAKISDTAIIRMKFKTLKAGTTTPATFEYVMFESYDDTDCAIYAEDDSVEFGWVLTVTDGSVNPEPKTYDVTFVADGATVGTVTVEEGAAVPADKIPAVPAKAGYTGVWGTIPATITKNTTVTAVYTPVAATTYTVTFVADGATVGTATVEEGKAVSANQIPVVPAKTGYTGEWGTIPATITKDTTVTAVYTAKQYTVTFVVDNRGVTNSQLVWTVPYNTASSAITLPTVTAASDIYRFEGWDKNLPATITDNITITAVFVSTGAGVTITFVGGANGTLFAEDNLGNDVVLKAGDTHSIEVESGNKAGATFTCPAPVADDNYHFVGWYVGDKAYNFDSVVEGDITLTAKFALNDITMTNFELGETSSLGYPVGKLYLDNNNGVDIANEDIWMVIMYQFSSGGTNLVLSDAVIEQDADGNWYIMMMLSPSAYVDFDVYLIDGEWDAAAANWNVIDVMTGIK